MASIPGPHTGILREENHIVRQIFGYGNQKTTLGSLPQTGTPLTGTLIKDVLLVSVDVDTGGGYEFIAPDQSFHVGVSIFDTRWLTSKNLPTGAIASYQFINQETKPCQKAARRFLLGATERLTLPVVASRILSLTQGRDYILVGHGTREDIKFLNNINPEITSKACYILDTVKVAQHVLNLYYRYSLEKLLSALRIPYDDYRLHSAGNDAFFALKGLLMLVSRDMNTMGQLRKLENLEVIDEHSLTAKALEVIASIPYPTPTTKPPGPEKPPKLSLGAKGRAKRERKAIRRAKKELADTDELVQGGPREETGTRSESVGTTTPTDCSCSSSSGF